MDQDDDLPQRASDSTQANDRWHHNVSRQHWLELFSVVILSVASLAAAWGGYQAAKWNGVQAAKYAEASAARIEATRLNTTAYQLALIDLQAFNGYTDAVGEGNEPLADFHQSRFRDEFRIAFDAWIAQEPLTNPEAITSPLLMPEYAPVELAESERLLAEATALYDEGAEAGSTADEYVLTTVFLAAVLFFAGISARLDWFTARAALHAVAAAMLLLTLFQLAAYPIN